MSNSIVQVNVNINVAPTPATLQQSGASISHGGTSLTPGTFGLLTQLSDLTPLLTVPATISATVWGSSVVTVTTTQPHGLPLNQAIKVVIAGSSPAGYNGTFPATITGASTFTYPLTTNPGTIAVEGTWLNYSGVELVQMATTFFAQGFSTSVSVLELGPGSPDVGVAALSAYITTNPNSNYTPGALGYFYSYLVPRSWDANVNFLNLLQSYESPTSRTYFFVTTTLQTWGVYTALQKCVVGLIESPPFGVYPANALTAAAYSGTYPANALTALTWSAAGGGTATALTTTAHSIQVGQLFTLSGSTPAGYNGTFMALPGTSGSTLIYALAVNPGTETVLGTLVASTTGTVSATTTTPHNVQVGQYFTITGCAPSGYNGTFRALTGTQSTTLVYGVASALGAETMLGTLQASLYANTGVTTTEFSHAANFWNALHYAPSTTNKVTPYAFSYVYGVTPFPTQGHNALLASLKAANINVIGTGAEGGISNTILLWGTTMDGNDFTYWYSVDWVQIELDLMTANAVINGSNNPINPLYYNQPGIDTLQAVAASTMTRGVTYGLVLGTVVQTALDGPVLDANIDAGMYADMTVVNAVPFVTYSYENPSDYKIGRYAGFAVVYMPQRGFINIVYNLTVTELIAQ